MIGAGVLCLLGGAVAWADSQFIIDNPPLDYEVIDTEPFDGFGDFGPFPDSASVLLGYTGEAREVVEFDIAPFQVPAGERISSALFQAYIADNNIAGMGIAGITPASVACHGYVGNGIPELSDFEAGNGNFLAREMLGEHPYIGQQLTFDVTDFVKQLVDTNQTWVGLTVRAEQLGGIMLFEGRHSPMLTIQTVPVPEPSALATLALAGLAVLRRR